MALQAADQWFLRLNQKKANEKKQPAEPLSREGCMWDLHAADGQHSQNLYALSVTSERVSSSARCIKYNIAIIHSHIKHMV